MICASRPMPTPVIGCCRISASSDGVNFFFILWPHKAFLQSISLTHLETIGCDGRHMQKPSLDHGPTSEFCRTGYSRWVFEARHEPIQRPRKRVHSFGANCVTWLGEPRRLWLIASDLFFQR